MTKMPMKFDSTHATKHLKHPESAYGVIYTRHDPVHKFNLDFGSEKKWIDWKGCSRYVHYRLMEIPFFQTHHFLRTKSYGKPNTK